MALNNKKKKLQRRNLELDGFKILPKYAIDKLGIILYFTAPIIINATHYDYYV